MTNDELVELKALAESCRENPSLQFIKVVLDCVPELVDELIELRELDRWVKEKGLMSKPNLKVENIQVVKLFNDNGGTLLEIVGYPNDGCITFRTYDNQMSVTPDRFEAFCLALNELLIFVKDGEK